MNVTFDYGDKALMWEMRIWNPYGMENIDNGVAVYGSEGSVHIGRWERQWGFKVFDKAGKMVLHDEEKEPEVHQQNFIESVRSRKLPNADIGKGHISADPLPPGEYRRPHRPQRAIRYGLGVDPRRF